MKTYFFQVDQQGNVVMYSENPIGSDVLDQIMLQVTDEQEGLMKQNYSMKILGGILELSKTPQLLQEEKEHSIENAKTVLEQKIENGSVTVQDLSQFLLITK